MRAAVALLAVTVCIVSARAEDDPLLAVLESPPATGFLVTFVGEGSQAAGAGISVGDTLLSYGGIPTSTSEDITRAKEKSAGAETVQAVIVHADGKHAVVALKPGPIGINGIPVVKGEKPTLPEATVASLDLSPLAKGPRDQWQAFSLDGRTKVGFEHAAMRLEGSRLTVRREVAFDGGEQWGLNHFVVTVVAEVGERVTPLSTSFSNPITGWAADGKLETLEDGTREWRLSWTHGEESGTRGATLPDDVLPDYLVETVVLFLPREPGTCYRFRPLTEATARLGLPAALIGVGEEEIEHRGGKVKAFKFEQRRLGGTIAGTYWIGDDGRALKVGYGGAWGTACTKEEALADLHPDLKPRTAD